MDVLVLGGGPAALCIASELNQWGVAVGCIAPDPVDGSWPATSGGWAYYDDPPFTKQPTWATSFCTALVLPTLSRAGAVGVEVPALHLYCSYY